MTSLTRFDRIMLLVALAAILGGLGWLVVGGAPIEREFASTIFHEEAGRQVTTHDAPQRLLPLLGQQERVFARGLALAWSGFFVLFIALRRASRRLGFRMDRRVMPLLVPLAVGLVALPLVHWRFEEQLVDAYVMLGGEPDFAAGCYLILMPCSRLQALHAVWNAAIVLACVATALAFVREAPRAWRGGEHGLVLSRGWSRFAVALFVTGAAALVFTMRHAADRELAASTCVDERDEGRPDPTPAWFDGPSLSTCEGVPRSMAHSLHIDRHGWPVDSLDPRQLAELLADLNEWRADLDDASAIELELFVDLRTSPRRLEPYLDVAQAHGIERVVLLGRAEVEGESALVGRWVRRSLCPVGELILDDAAARSLGDFEDFGALQAAARGGPLRVRSDATPRFTRDRCNDEPDDEESPLGEL